MAEGSSYDDAGLSLAPLLHNSATVSIHCSTIISAIATIGALKKEIPLFISENAYFLFRRVKVWHGAHLCCSLDVSTGVIPQ